MTALPIPVGTSFLANNNDRKKPLAIGETHKQDHGHSQFCGSWTFKVTEVRENGDVYGTYLSGTVYEMDIEDLM